MSSFSLIFTLVTMGAPSDEPPANGGGASDTRAPRDYRKSASMWRRPGAGRG